MGNLDDMPKIQVYYNSKSPKQTEYYNNFKKEIIKKVGFIGFSVFDVKNSEFCIKFQYGEETTTVQEKFDGNADAIEKTCKKIESIVNQIKEKEEINKLNAKNKKNDNNIKHNENKNNNKNLNINYDNENKTKNKKKITPNIETFNNKNKINEKEKKNNIEKKIIIKNEDKLIIDNVKSKESNNISKTNFNMINNIQIKKNKNKTNNDKINEIQNKENNNKIEKINDIQILNKENNNIISDNINDIQNRKNNNKIINDKINDIQNKKSNNKIINDKNNDIKRKKNKNKIINDKINDIQDEVNNNNINNNYKFKSNETTVITYYNTRSPKQTEYYNNFKEEIKKKLYINDFSVIDIKKNADFCIKLKCGEEIVTVQERFDGTKNAIDKIRKKIEELVEINKIEEKTNFNTINENIYNKLQINNIFDINDNDTNNINNKKKKKKKKKKLFRSK